MSCLPREPDAIADPKATIVDLARHSRRRELREDLVPRPGSGRSTGPIYAGRLAEFAERDWRPNRAAMSSDSLRRCLAALHRLATGHTG
jgi:hypothetical protein